jgi:hypothetical protein
VTASIYYELGIIVAPGTLDSAADSDSDGKIVFSEKNVSSHCDSTEA